MPGLDSFRLRVNKQLLIWQLLMQARATRGVYKGTWYFEIKVTHLGKTGHCRLGWSTKKGELQVRHCCETMSHMVRCEDLCKGIWCFEIQAVHLGKTAHCCQR